jgi:cyclic lactone autoinducer peptide
MKRLNKLVKMACPAVGSVLTTIAVVGGVQAFSFWSFYQPKAPKCLKK